MNKPEKENKSLVSVFETVVQIPGVKVNREEFLLAQFKNEPFERRSKIVEVGPIRAKCSKKELKSKAKKLVTERMMTSAGASFLAGLPGGIAMAATIPADTLQFYAIALRLAQEIVYLYGEEDLWLRDAKDDGEAMNSLILYCGVMLGAAGAAHMVRMVAAELSKKLLKTLPQKALTKTVYYPIVKSIAKAIGAKMTKEVFAKGVSKAVPVIGGVVSGGITLATMRPMGMRLIEAMDDAHFGYTESDFESDWKVVQEIIIEGESDTEGSDID